MADGKEAEAITYHGHVRNGAVVLESPVALPEGAEVSVDVRVSSATTESPNKEAATPTDPFWGLLGDEPELVEQLTAEILSDREQRRLRTTDV